MPVKFIDIPERDEDRAVDSPSTPAAPIPGEIEAGAMSAAKGIQERLDKTSGPKLTTIEPSRAISDEEEAIRSRRLQEFMDAQEEPGIIGDVTTSAFRGAARGALEYAQMVQGAIGALERFSGVDIPGGGIPQQAQLQAWEDSLGQPQTMAGQFAEPIAQFALPFSVAQKTLTAAGIADNLLRAYTVGALTDFAVFDPYEEDLFNRIAELKVPGLSPAVERYIASNEEDPEIVARLKQSLRGGLMGGAMDGVFGTVWRGIQAAKGTRMARQMAGRGVRVMGKPSVQSIDPQTAGRDLDVIAAEAARVKSVFEKSHKEYEEMEQSVTRRVKDLFHGRHWWDASVDVHRRLERTGEAGEAVVNRHILTLGAPELSKKLMHHYDDEIFQGISRTDKRILDNVVRARRIKQIKAYKGEKWKAEGDLQSHHMESYLEDLRAEKGEAYYQEMMGRSDKIFQAMRDQLDALKEHGLIDDKLYKQLNTLNYTPTQWLNKLDPTVANDQLKRRKISVRESGIGMLERGNKGQVALLDTRELLAQTIYRTHTRILRNEANKSMLAWARQQPNNGMVKVPQNLKLDKNGNPIAKPPKGFVTLHAREDGKMVPFYMEQDLAQQWIVNDPAMTFAMSSMMRTLSGTGITKATATGYNPGFVLVDYPRNLFQAAFGTRLYSRNLPIAFLQIHKDLIEVAGQAIKRKGPIYDQYIDNGGGLNLLAHQGKDLFGAEEGMRHSMSSTLGKLTTLQKVKNALSYLGETEELMFRLAIMNRSMKQGKSVADSAAESRKVADFGQGGQFAKGLDQMWPYLNATIQSIRPIMKNAAKHPVEFGYKAAQLLALDAAMHQANYQNNPEAYAQVSDFDKTSSWIITTDKWFLDEYGNKRHVYFKISKPIDLMLLMAPVDHMMIQQNENRTPVGGLDFASRMWGYLREAGQTAGRVVPDPQTAVPNVAALHSYYSGYDFFTGRESWGRDKLQYPYSKQEYYVQGEGREPTEQFWVDWGEFTGLSPERSKAAIGQVAAENPVSTLSRWGWEGMTSNMTDYQKSRHVYELISSTPMLRRVVRITHPGVNEIDPYRRLEDAETAERWKVMQKIDSMYYSATRSKDSETTLRDVENYIDTNVPEQLKKSARDHYVAARKLDEVFKRYSTLSPYVPDRVEWTRAVHASPEVKANWYYNRWRDADPQGREQMEKIRGAMPGFWSERAAREYQKLRSEWGIER